jgi:Uma2 family endonuclease
MTAAPVAPMPDVTTGGFTVAYLHRLPDDGLRRELINGSILVSPSATSGHNMIARWIAQLLEAAAPDKRFLVSMDQSVTIDSHNELRPDVVVARAEVMLQTPFPSDALMLAVEVASPSSSIYDIEIKKAVYARAGVPAYWILVPNFDADTLALAELRLDTATGQYMPLGPSATGVFRTDWPWPVEIDLAALAADLAGFKRSGRSKG